MQKGEPFDEELLWNYLIQIANGLKYLNDKRILHRDIKPQNIFLDKNNNIKIGDMGLGKILGSQSNYAYTNCGTRLYFLWKFTSLALYLSPELINEQPYNFKSDIWAFGCLMYELATFRPPFVASNQIALSRKIMYEEPEKLPVCYFNVLIRFRKCILWNFNS